MRAVTGEWWNADPIAVVNAASSTGAAPNISDAFTINGQPGDLYQCSSPGIISYFPVMYQTSMQAYK